MRSPYEDSRWDVLNLLFGGALLIGAVCVIGMALSDSTLSMAKWTVGIFASGGAMRFLRG